MPRTALRVRRWAAIAVLGGLLAGCGTGEADTGGPAVAPGSAGARTSTDVRPIEAATRITDAKGVTVSLPKPPEKIVCLVALCDDILVELGLTPTATNSQVLAHPEFLGKEKAAKIPVVPGGFLSPEVEAILSHRPDLVIGLEDTHGKLAPALKGATTFWPVQPGSWQDSVGYLRDLAALTGRTVAREHVWKYGPHRVSYFRGELEYKRNGYVMCRALIDSEEQAVGIIAAYMRAEWDCVRSEWDQLSTVLDAYGLPAVTR